MCPNTPNSPSNPSGAADGAEPRTVIVCLPADATADGSRSTSGVLAEAFHTSATWSDASPWTATPHSGI
jgi:hypothetical protein